MSVSVLFLNDMHQYERRSVKNQNMERVCTYRVTKDLWEWKRSMKKRAFGFVRKYRYLSIQTNDQECGGRREV
jgi:hypothetical protein